MENQFNRQRAYRMPSTPQSLNEETRTITVTAATENPVKMWDYEHGEVNEIILLRGMEIPEDGRVPLIDSHNSRETSSVIGTASNFRQAGDEMLADVVFSSIAQDQFTKVKEGHLRDFSVGYRVKPQDSILVEPGATWEGRSYENRTLLRTKWDLKELSLVPIGADSRAKVRADIDTQTTGTGGKEREMEKKDEVVKPDETGQVRAETVKPGNPEDMTRAERERVTEIFAMRDIGIEDAQIKEWVDSGTSIAECRKRALAFLVSKKNEVPATSPAKIIHDGVDKFREFATDALLTRGGIIVSKPGENELAGMSAGEICREMLRVSGKDFRGSKEQIITRALMTGDLPNILANVANKSVLAGFEEERANSSWRVWCGIGSLSDFKTATMARASEFSDLDETPEGVPPIPGTISDKKEQTALKTYTKEISITRQALVNDDLNAIDMLRKMGIAAERKVCDLPYAVLAANAAMGDGITLFHTSSHGANSSGSYGAIGMTTLGTAFTKMALQKDIQTLQPLNIVPKYALLPVASKSAAEIFFSSTTFSDNSTAATDSTFASTRTNIYGGDVLTRVYDARIDADSASQWFLAADKGKTINVYFLNGKESPTIEQIAAPTVMGVRYVVFIDAVSKAIDWVGLYRNKA